jgi:nitrosocyanin
MRRLAIGLAAMGLLWLGSATTARAEPVSFTVVNVEFEGTKLWMPSTLVVKRGTQVTIKLVNNAPSEPSHGFAIPAYGLATVVPRGEPKQLAFTADREGIFPVICQLHPAHVGGQLVVLP